MVVSRIIETISLFLLILVTALRPLVTETYDSGGVGLTTALDAISDPEPLHTLVFDLLILVAACGWLLARAIGPARRYRRTGLEWGALIVLVAAVVSCIAAGNKRLAINASIDWLCYPLLAIALVQLMPRPWHRGILLTAVLASAVVQSAKCLDDYYVGFDDTLEHYEQIKEDLWTSQGIELDSPKVELFERRLKASEASGFMPHGNITGSYLVLCGIAAIGVALAGGRRPTDATGPFLKVIPFVGAAFILIGVFLTHSLGAILSGVAGLFLWPAVTILRPWMDAHRGKAVAAGWGAALLGVIAVAGHGTYHGSLPGSSLGFRWQYWTASSNMIRDHALTGVGRENFGRHYLQYKPIEAAEEIANPHNLFVQTAAEWGVIGLVGMSVLLIGASLAATRATPVAPPDSEEGLSPPSGPVLMAWAVALAVALVLARIPLLGSDDPNYLYFMSVAVGLIWLAGFACFSPAILSGRRHVIATATAIGLFTFLLHDMISFAVFVPGAATALCAALAFCIAERSPVEPVPAVLTRAKRWLPLTATGIAIVCILVVAVIPVARAARYTQRAIALARGSHKMESSVQQVDEMFLKAMDADRLDVTPCIERARWWLARSLNRSHRAEALQRAVDSLREAVRRDPYQVAHQRRLLQLHLARARHTGEPDDYHAAIASAKRACALYPADPGGYVSLADCQLEAGEALPSDDLLRDAVHSYDRAVELDDARPEWEIIRGFKERERQEIDTKTHRANRLLAGES